jgi:hypothetical protein
VLFYRLSGVICRPTGGIGPIFTSYRQTPGVKEYLSLHIEVHVCDCDRCLGTGNPNCSDHQSHSTFELGEDMFDMATYLRLTGIGLGRGTLHRPTCGLLAMDAARFADAREVFFVLGRTIRGISPDVRLNSPEFSRHPLSLFFAAVLSRWATSCRFLHVCVLRYKTSRYNRIYPS